MKIVEQIFSEKLPVWFILFNLCILLPILFWPVVVLGLLFAGVSFPSWHSYLLFFVVVIAYPVYLVLMAFLNCRIFRKSKIIGLLLPAAIFVLMIRGICWWWSV